MPRRTGTGLAIEVASRPARRLLELADALFLLDKREAVSVLDPVT